MQVTSTSKKMPKQSRWLIVLPLMIWFMSAFFYFQQYFLRTSLSSLGDNLMASFMVTPETISNLATVFYAVFVIMQFFVGITIDKCGVRICLSLAAIVCGIGAFVFGFAAAVWMLYLGRILMGAGAAYALVGTLTLASWWFSERLFVLINGVTFTLGILGAFFAEGPFASVLEYMNWYIVMVVAGVICVVLGLLIFFLLPRRAAYQTQPEKSEDRHTWRDIKTIFGSGQFWLLCIFLGLTYVGLEMYSGLWCQPFLMAKYHFSEDLAGNISAMAFIGYAVGNLVVGAVIAKKPHIITGAMRICILLSTILVAIYIYVPLNVVLLFIVSFFFGFFLSAVILTVVVIKHITIKPALGTAFSVSEVFKHIFSIAAIQFVGLLLTHFTDHSDIPKHMGTTKDYMIVLIAVPVSMILALLFSLFIKSYKRQVAAK